MKKMPPHGIMFHHFHGGQHIPMQGSIASAELADMITDLKEGFNLLSAEDWYQKAVSDKLEPSDVCLTFDDSLRCQFDIAFPVLENFNIKAFWFVITSPLDKKIEKLELYRYYRMAQFSHVDEFYAAFNALIQDSAYSKEVELALRGDAADQYLLHAPFYSKGDRIFRYVRDVVLGKQKYEELMDSMIADSRFCIDDRLLKLLWMDEACLRELGENGHIIGLHSHTHPFHLSQLSRNEQELEYKTNMMKLKEILNKDIISMSHSGNFYNNTTLEILRDMKIRLGFRADMEQRKYSNLEQPRLDSTLLKRNRK